MSLQLRRVVTVTVVSAALLAVLPAPAHAIPPWELGAARLATHLWAWLLGLPPASATPPSSRGEKEGTAINPDGQPALAPTGDEEGTAINPDGIP